MAWKKLRLLAAGLVVAALALGAAACGDDDDEDDDGATTPEATRAAGTTPATNADDGAATGEEAEVEAAIEAAVAAWNGKDVDGLIAGFTDAGLVNTFGEEGQPAEEVAAALPEFIGSEPISDAEFNDVTISGDTATADLQWRIGPALQRVEITLVDVDGMWKIDNQEEDLKVEVPAGTAEVPIDLNEFAFALDASLITDADGPVALTANNVGEQQHELGLARIPADADIDELLRSEDDPPGVEFIAGIGPIEPGDDESLVLAEPLEPGRYVMVCFLPDTTEGPDGTPHALKGMVKEFTIE